MSFFAVNLKKLRTAKKLSQSAFAQLFGLTRSTVGAYEEGRAEPKLDKLIEIAQYFKLTVDQIIARPLTVSDIFHLDKKIPLDKATTNKIKFVPYDKTKNYINFLSGKGSFEFYYLEIDGLDDEIAFETSEGEIFFCTKGEHSGDYKKLIVCKDGIFYKNFETLKQNNILELWEVRHILTTAGKCQSNNETLLKTIDTKIDLLLELHKKQK